MQTLLLVTQTIIATLIIYLGWGYDAPMGNFALVFGGLLLGHTITEALNVTNQEGEEE